MYANIITLSYFHDLILKFGRNAIRKWMELYKIVCFFSFVILLTPCIICILLTYFTIAIHYFIPTPAIPIIPILVAKGKFPPLSSWNLCLQHGDNHFCCVKWKCWKLINKIYVWWNRSTFPFKIKVKYAHFTKEKQKNVFHSWISNSVLNNWKCLFDRCDYAKLCIEL